MNKEKGTVKYSEIVVNIINRSPEERIEWLRQPRWIGYGKAKEILDKLEELISWPKVHRMPNLLILGHTNNGKTTIVEHFVKKHPAEDLPNEDFASVPVLLVQAPPKPDESRFYNVILDKLFAPYKATEHVSKRQAQVLSILKSVNCRMLIIDEIHHIIAGRQDAQRQFLNVIKYLGNELQIPIVGVGIKEAIRAIQSDPQLANRFEPIAIPRWELNPDFQKLLASFERVLPLKIASNLHQKDLARELYVRSEGSIGELSRLVNELSIEAIKSGVEKIDLKLVQNSNWVSPSERRRAAEKLL